MIERWKGGSEEGRKKDGKKEKNAERKKELIGNE